MATNFEKLLEDSDASAQLLHSSLLHFIAVFHEYMTGAEFEFRPFHLDIIQQLEDIAFCNNKKRNQYFAVPPRSGKTLVMKLFVAWCYSNNPSCNFIWTSYGDTLVENSSAEIKSIITSDLYQKLFCKYGSVLSRDSKSKALWRVGDKGIFRASPLGGVITGFGAGTKDNYFGGCIIIDDFMKAADSNSAVTKRSVNEYYSGTLKSRRNSPKTPMVIIAQRLAPDDLIGYIEEKERDDWNFYIAKGLNDDDKSIWEDAYSAKDLIRLRETDPFTFYSQYQQEPTVRGGEVFKAEWWQFYDTSSKLDLAYTFIFADTAMKVAEHNDYSVFTLWGVGKDRKLYLLDILRGKYEAPELHSKFIEFYKLSSSKKYVTGVYIEDKASGTGLIQSVKRTGYVPIIPWIPNKDKLSRVMDCIPQIYAGNILMPDNKNHPICSLVFSETEAFRADMGHKHDDIVDCISGASAVNFDKKGFF